MSSVDIEEQILSLPPPSRAEIAAYTQYRAAQKKELLELLFCCVCTQNITLHRGYPGIIRCPDPERKVV